MTFWLVLGLMTAAAMLIVVSPLFRRGPPPAAAGDMAVYRDQLEEIDRDLARGAIAPAEAEAAPSDITPADRGGGARRHGRDRASAGTALMLVAPPLILLAQPRTVDDRRSASRRSPHLGCAALATWSPAAVRGLAQTLCPATAWLIAVGILWLWHVLGDV